MLDFGGCGEWQQPKFTTAKREHSCSFLVIVAGWLIGCGVSSQRKPTSAEIKHECSISALVGDGQWVVMVVAARWSLQALELSTNA